MCAWFKGFGTNIIFLTGQLKGKKRQQALDAIADGKTFRLEKINGN